MLARQMEVYAGFLEHTDHHIGRLVDAIEDLGVLEDTLVYYIIGDNGASAEGTVNGSFNEMFIFNGADALETPEFVASRIDELGTPTAYNHYAVGWAHAMDTPYQWTKQVASHWGGTRNGTIVHWPAGHQRQGRGAGTVPPRHRRGADRARGRRAARADRWSTGSPQRPDRGREHGATPSTSADAAERRTTQYFEMFCNRGIYHQGWTAVTRHSTPWVMGRRCRAFDDDVWELYDTTTDWSQSRDLAAEMPEKLARAAASCG